MAAVRSRLKRNRGGIKQSVGFQCNGREEWTRISAKNGAKTGLENETAGDSHLHADEKEGWTTWPEGWP